MPKQTLFGFQSRDTRQCGITILGWPQIEPDMTFACLMKEENNWQTLQGWKNLDTGEIAGPDIGRIAGAAMTCLLISLYAFGLMQRETLQFHWAMQALLGLFPLLSLVGAAKTWSA